MCTPYGGEDTVWEFSCWQRGGEREPDFFKTFAGRAREVGGIGRIAFATGESDLPGPAVAGAGGAFNEEEGGGGVRDVLEVEKFWEGGGGVSRRGVRGVRSELGGG